MKKQLLQCPNVNMTLVAKTADEDGKIVLLYRPTCKSWTCAYCASRLRQSWGQRVYHGIVIGKKFWGWDCSFVTVTSHEKLKTFEATAAVWPRVWSKLAPRLRRQYGRFEYARIPEMHRDGRLHFHFVMSICPRKKWLKDNSRSSGAGYQADIQRISDGEKAAWYVTKYLGKTLGSKSDEFNRLKMRRISLSQGWPDQPRRGIFDIPDVTWEIAEKEGSGEHVARHYAAMGYRVRKMGSWGDETWEEPGEVDTINYSVYAGKQQQLITSMRED